MKLMHNVMEFEVVSKDGERRNRTVEVTALWLAVSRSPPRTLRKSRYLLTEEDTIEVEEPRTLGEVEYVAVKDKGETFITAGSDHLDATLSGMVFQNAARAYDPAKAKQLCPAVVARQIWPYGEVRDHWDVLRLKSQVTVGGKLVTFQDFPISQLVSLERHLDANPRLRDDGTVLFSGSGDPAESAPVGLYDVDAGEKGIFPLDFHFELADPVLGRRISHSYTVQVLERPAG